MRLILLIVIAIVSYPTVCQSRRCKKKQKKRYTCRDIHSVGRNYQPSHSAPLRRRLEYRRFYRVVRRSNCLPISHWIPSLQVLLPQHNPQHSILWTISVVVLLTAKEQKPEFFTVQHLAVRKRWESLFMDISCSSEADSKQQHYFYGQHMFHHFYKQVTAHFSSSTRGKSITESSIYTCSLANQSYPNPNPDPNPTTKQHAVVSIQLNIVTCPTYPRKFIRDNVTAPYLLLSTVTVTQHFISATTKL